MTREDAIKIFNTVLLFGKCDCPKEEIEECLKMAIKALEQEPKTGHWISHREHCENLGIMMPNSIDVYEWCSNCDCGIDVREWYRNHYNYCPNCGAKMDRAESEE